MALKADFQSILQVFIYSNLPTLMNPANATNVVVTNAIIPTTPTTSMTPTIATTPNTSSNNTVTTTASTASAITTATTTSASNDASTTTTSTASTSNSSTIPVTTTSHVIMITPTVLQAIQSYVLNNFPDIGLPQDIQQIAKNFLSNLPPIVPINPTTSLTATSASTTS